MPDKDNFSNNDINKGSQGEELGRSSQPDTMKSYIPDFQYTPPTPSTPPPAQGNSGSENQGSSSSGDE